MPTQTPIIKAYLAANPYQNPQQATQKQPVAPKPKGNLLTHLLPTIGGTGGGVAGGAAGGALAGSAILPGVGTVAGGLLGALLGGAAGGATGKAVENKVEGKKISSGVGGQALEQGILSAGPIKLLKGATIGAKAGVGAVREGGGLAGGINAAAEKANTSMLKNGAKNLVTQGQQAQGRVSGISAGSKIAGKELSPQDTKQMLTTLKQEGIKTGNANNTFRDVQDKLTQYGKQIGDHFTANDAPLSKSATKTIASDYIKSLKTSDPAILKQANVLATDLKNNVTSTKSLWEFRKSLDAKIPDIKQGADEATTAKVSALKALRRHVTDQLGSVPGAKNYHALSEIKPFISAESKRLNNPGGGIVGRIASSGPVQKAESAIGKATEGTGNVINNVGTNPVGLGSIASRTVPVGLAQGVAANQPSNVVTNQNMNQANASQSMSDNMGSLSQNPTDLSSALMQAGQGSGSPYSQENLLTDIQRDPRNADKYIAHYQSLDKIFNPDQGTSGKLNSTQLQQANNAQSGIDSLNEIAQTLQQNPNATKLSKLPGGSLTSSLTGTGSYKAAVNNAADVIGRLRSGGAINADEEKRFMSLLPGSFDDQNTVNYKLQSLYSLFNSFADPQASQQATSTSPVDLTSALMQAGYQ